MAVASFKNVSWSSNETLDTTKFNTMCSNTRYLFERAPRLSYNAYGASKSTGIKFACGVVAVAPSKTAWTTAKISWGTFFTTGSKPAITTTWQSGSNGKVFLSIYGKSGPYAAPDHRGFYCRVAVSEANKKNQHVIKTSYVNYIAMGY